MKLIFKDRLITSLGLSGGNHRKSTPRWTTAGISLKSNGVVTCTFILWAHFEISIQIQFSALPWNTILTTKELRKIGWLQLNQVLKNKSFQSDKKMLKQLPCFWILIEYCSWAHKQKKQLQTFIAIAQVLIPCSNMFSTHNHNNKTIEILKCKYFLEENIMTNANANARHITADIPN